MPDWAIIAHGGAKAIKPDEEQDNHSGLREAIRIGSRILAEGGTALEAVEEVVKHLEEDPTFNAGLHGSVKNEEGKVELCASIMDGKTLNIGAVTGLQEIQNPISVAR